MTEESKSLHVASRGKLPPSVTITQLRKLNAERTPGEWIKCYLDTDNPNPTKQAVFKANVYCGTSVVVKDKKDAGYVCLVPYETGLDDYKSHNAAFIANAPAMFALLEKYHAALESILRIGKEEEYQSAEYKVAYDAINSKPEINKPKE